MFEEIPLHNTTPRPQTGDSSLSTADNAVAMKSSSNLMPSKPDEDKLQLQPPQPPVKGGSDLSLAETAFVPEKRPRRRGLSRYFLSEIESRWSDVPLMICCFIGGLVDGLSYNYWGSFVNMQTGNTIYIALGVAGKPNDPPMLWAKSLTAVLSFLIGTFIFTHGCRLLGPTRRLTLILSFALQALIILAAALVLQFNGPHFELDTTLEWKKAVAIALLSFQSSGQLAASRFLAYPEIPTVLLTALVCDLILDPNLYKKPWGANPKRNRRMGALMAHFFGAMTAGGMAKDVGLPGGLWLAFSLKGALTITWCLWKEKKDPDEEQASGKR